MDKYSKATEYLNSVGFKAFNTKDGVAVLLHNDDVNKRRCTDLTHEKIDYYAGLYDAMYGGYSTLKDILAWADKQRECDIIDLSLEELINEYRMFKGL